MSYLIDIDVNQQRDPMITLYGLSAAGRVSPSPRIGLNGSFSILPLGSGTSPRSNEADLPGWEF